MIARRTVYTQVLANGSIKLVKVPLDHSYNNNNCKQERQQKISSLPRRLTVGRTPKTYKYAVLFFLFLHIFFFVSCVIAIAIAIAVACWAIHRIIILYQYMCCAYAINIEL